LFEKTEDITFFVDEIKLEDGKRGDRVRSQIYQEIFRNFKDTYLNWHGIKEGEGREGGVWGEGRVMSSFSDHGMEIKR